MCFHGGLFFNQECTNAGSLRIISVTANVAKIQPLLTGEHAKSAMQRASFERVLMSPAVIGLSAECVGNFKGVFLFHVSVLFGVLYKSICARRFAQSLQSRSVITAKVQNRLPSRQ